MLAVLAGLAVLIAVHPEGTVANFWPTSVSLWHINATSKFPDTIEVGAVIVIEVVAPLNAVC